MIANILSRNPIDDSIYRTRDEPSDSAPQRTANDARGETKCVPCPVTINRRDNRKMLQGIDDIDEIPEAHFGIFP